MKRLFTILLIFTAITYILPVKEVLAYKYEISMTDVEDVKSEKNKKECFFITFTEKFVHGTNKPVLSAHQDAGYIPEPVHSIETPPPDFI